MIRHPIWRGVAAVVWLLAAAVPAAAADEVFAVTAPVDVTGTAAAAAQAQAIAEGQRAAFRRLVRRLVAAGQIGAVPPPDGAALTDMVQGFTVENEKRSSVRYLADFNVRFKPQAVRRYLRDHGIRFAETPSRPVVVVPVLREAGAVVLWGDPNPWRAAWAAAMPRDGLVPMVVPAGDLADVNTISAEQAISGNRERLVQLAARHSASSSLLARAELGQEPASARTVLDVSVIWLDRLIDDETFVQRYTAPAEAPVEELMKQAANAVAEEIEARWKQDNVKHFDRPNEIVVSVPLRGFEDWIDIRGRLRRVAFVDAVDVVAVGRNEAALRLSFPGTSEQLQLALAQSDLLLSERAPGEWALTRAVAPTAAPRPAIPASPAE